MTIPVRRSIRLPDFDYTRPGAYFVTICAHDRACLFGDVVDGMMRVNGFGEIVQQIWDAVPDHFPHVALDQFVIMPNHVHGIIVLNDDDRVGAGSPRPNDIVRHEKTGGETPPLHRPLLGQVVGYFKYQSTKRINLLRHAPAQPVWQRNYYEHVIRNDRDLAAIRDYIAGNPARWPDDDNNPERAIAQQRNRQNPLGFFEVLR